MLANNAGKDYDAGGEMAASGSVNIILLEKLNDLAYYNQSYPKSLANDFGTDVIYPMIRDLVCSIVDRLRTFVEHISIQIKRAIISVQLFTSDLVPTGSVLLATGGGALNAFLIERLNCHLKDLKIEVAVPDERLINYKEALIMAFIGVLRWRQEYNVLSSVTGAARDSIGGALWTGQEA